MKTCSQIQYLCETRGFSGQIPFYQIQSVLEATETLSLQK